MNFLRNNIEARGPDEFIVACLQITNELYVKLDRYRCSISIGASEINCLDRWITQSPTCYRLGRNGIV